MSYAKKPLPPDSALAHHLKQPPVGSRLSFPTKREMPADIVAQIIDEHARVENGKVSNTAYLAVKIAELLEKL